MVFCVTYLGKFPLIFTNVQYGVYELPLGAQNCMCDFQVKYSAYIIAFKSKK